MSPIENHDIRSFLTAHGIPHQEHAVMALYTTYRTGGPADFLVSPETEEQIRDVILFAAGHGIPFRAMGGCSNVIVRDGGLPGISLMLRSNFAKIRRLGDSLVSCQAGCTLEALSEAMCSWGVSGYEFMYDIPGTVGGAVFMNAGNDLGTTAGVLASVRCMRLPGTVCDMEPGECGLGYRTSVFQTSNDIILGAVFAVRDRKPYDAIRRTMEQVRAQRRTKFPMEYPNAGSVFKRPRNDFAGRLIEEAGCGGLRVGDAQVSMKHKGFIVNLGKATSHDILTLIELVRRTVKEKTGVDLETEQRVME